MVCMVLMGISVFAQPRTLTLGGKNKWPAMSKMENISVGKGRFGFDSLELSTNSRVVDNYTDLLVDFENGRQIDVSGNYKITANSIAISKNSIMGKGSGLVRGNGGLRLQGKQGSLFGTEGNTGSWTIEFWLKPSIAENGEIIFNWRSSRTVAGYALYQMINASFFNNHVQWTFVNVFDGYTDNGGEVKLTSYRTIIPNFWSRHSITFDDDSGFLEYRIDGKLEAMAYITSNKRERGGSIFNPRLGVVADIELCPNFSGLVDDFRIQRKVETDGSMNYDTYSKTGGRFETQPLLVTESAVLNSIYAETNIPPQTDICYYVRSGDNFYNWTDEYPKWIPVENGQPIKGVKGLYFQIAVELFPDGGGMNTPSITQLDVNYTEVPLPLPPFKVSATAGDGCVTLNWNYSVDDTCGGYLVYYGERPGEYLGREAFEGNSPVKVGNTCSVNLTGLKNGKIYYFAVCSYSRMNDKITGSLSKEVSARPKRAGK